MGIAEPFAVIAVGMVAHDATVDRRESYFVDCAGVRAGGGGVVETSEGRRKGVLMIDEEASLIRLVTSDVCSARAPSSLLPWEVFSLSGSVWFTDLTVAISSSEKG